MKDDHVTLSFAADVYALGMVCIRALLELVPYTYGHLLFNLDDPGTFRLCLYPYCGIEIIENRKQLPEMFHSLTEDLISRLYTLSG